MSERIAVSSRKGLFFFSRKRSGWRLDAEAFLGSPVVNLLHDRRDGALYASLNLGHFGPKLHCSENDGAAWREIAMPSYPGADGADAPAVVQVWTIEEDGGEGAGGLWAGTIPGGLFHSADRGESWSLNESLWSMPSREKWMGGGYDKPGIHSVCVDPRDRSRIAVAVSTGGVWLSTDEGVSWSGRTKGMRAEYMPPDMAELTEAQDAHRMVQCKVAPDAYWLQHHNGIFLSEDGLASWREITPAPCPSFGFAVGVHPYDPKTAWFVPAVKDEHRYPKDGKFVVSRTIDGGKSFELFDRGLPSETSYDLVYRHGFAVGDDGRTLAIGSTTGGAWVSENAGESWEMLPVRLPPIAAIAFV